MNSPALTRRGFARFAGLLSAGAALPFSSEFALAQLSMVRGIPPGAVIINANENPLGPCPEAAEAITGMVAKGGRYLYEEAIKLEETLAAQEKVPVECVLAAAGSSLPLHHAVLAFTSPSRPLVLGDPGYEAGEWAAKVSGAPVRKIPLRKDYSHDVRAMASDSAAGLIYVCNPNNPTGTLTSRADLEWLVQNKPAGSIVMIDEAYLHIAGAEPCTDFVAAGKDVIILRTFSKIYGMAGLRAGAVIARRDLLSKVRSYAAGGLPITAMAGAVASLKSPTVVPERRKIIAAVRQDVFAFFDKHGFHYVPSVSNKFMVDVGRPGREIVQAMAREQVYIGRVWPAWPNHVRVTVGTAEEMSKFKTAFLKVMAA
jgi:histidinol-phosphate/aromatic aminotransferase/cobyric acid decarboxylase-like protein